MHFLFVVTHQIKMIKYQTLIKNIDTNKSIHKENLYEDLCMKDETNTGVDINSLEKIVGKNSKNMKSMVLRKNLQ